MFMTEQPIRVEEFLSQKVNPSCGASASFVGLVRNHHEGKEVRKLYYECYKSMAEKQITQIVQRAQKESPVNQIHVIHRVGWLNVGEAAVAVVAHAPHRKEAFLACRQVIDEIKHQVPIWKKEVYEDGSMTWTSCAAHEEVMT